MMEIRSQMSRRASLPTTLLLALGFCLAGATAGSASSYVGRGDTSGQGHTRKNDCCDAAIYMAQEDSIRACRRVGGFAEIPRGVANGRCKWDTLQGQGGRRYYRCTATASVSCKRR
jgi:hypothetical protein